MARKKLKGRNSKTGESITLLVDKRVEEIVDSSNFYPVNIAKIIGNHSISFYVDKDRNLRGNETAIVVEDNRKEVSTILEEYCANKDAFTADTTKEELRLLDSGCISVEARDASDNVVLLARQSLFELDRNIRSIERLKNDLDAKMPAEVSTRIKGIKDALKRFSNEAGKIRDELNTYHDFLKKDIALKETNYTEKFKKIIDFDAMMNEQIKNTPCKERTVRQLRETCKLEGITGCYRLNRDQLVELLCD